MEIKYGSSKQINIKKSFNDFLNYAKIDRHDLKVHECLDENVVRIPNLKNKLENGIKTIRSKEKKIQEEEKKIIQQKKIIKPEEYKSKVEALRNKVSKLQAQRSKLLESTANQRNTARKELLKNLNPIIKDYMKEKGIRMVVDKKSLLLADQNLDITKDIIEILNKKLKSINLK